MADHFVVQASGAMFRTISPEGWTYMFGVFVTDQDGTPVPGLKKSSFSVWELTNITDVTVQQMTEVNAVFPTSNLPGVYRLQTKVVLGAAALQPQEFVFAIRVGLSRRKIALQGITTVPITYLGKPQ